MKPSFQEFKIGNYCCAYGQQSDKDGNSINQWSVWLWNAHYWELLIPHCEPSNDFESAQYAAQWHLTKP